VAVAGNGNNSIILSKKELIMKAKVSSLLIIHDCGDELLDRLLATTNYDIEGNGAILLHTEDIVSPDLNDYLDTNYPQYEGPVLLRK
jgi:hypothetical protein